MGVRCMWYGDDGQPIQGNGCRNASCQYVHPTSPQWSGAIRRHTATFRGRGRGRGSFSSPSSRDTGWNGKRQTSTSSNPDWDPDAWKPKTLHNPSEFTASSASSSNNPETSTSKVVGQWGSQSASGSAADTGSGGWGENTGAWGSSGGGWGGEGGDSTGGWGGAWGSASIADPAPLPTVTPTAQPAARPTRPKDLQVDIDDRMAVDAPVPPQSASSYRATSQAPSEQVCATPQSAFPSFAVPASLQNMTRSQMHSGIIKNSVRVTRIRLELEELKRQLDGWKATQMSHQFHRVSAAAGDRLNNIRHELAKKITLVTTRLQQAEGELLRFPDLSSSAPNLIDVDKEMMAYTDELKAWLQSFAALAVSETKPLAPSLSSDSSLMDVEPAESETQGPLSPFAETEERIAKLEEKLVEVEQAVHDPDVASPQRTESYIDEVISAARSKLDGGPSMENAVGGTGALADLQSEADELNRKLRSQAEQIVLLMQENAVVKERIAHLEGQRNKHHRLKLAMRSQLENAETWKWERSKKMAQMSDHITRLATQHPQPTPVLDEAVLPRVQATVETMIQKEVLPALESLRMQYTGAVERRTKMLQQSLQQWIQPALDQTNEIRQRAELINLREF